MSAEIKNRFIKGSFVFGGKYCEHCLELGIICKQSGLLLSDANPLGQSTVDIGGIGSLKIPGILQNCKIATGRVPQKSGTDQIKAEAERAIKEAINKIKFEDLDEETIDFKPNIWS